MTPNMNLQTAIIFPSERFRTGRTGSVSIRTISDALANESILDMQGITEAVSRYYFANGESFEGLSVTPEYQEAFERLAQDARFYYDS